MRNISFSLTTPQFRNRTKTVTRRLGWKNVKVGEHLMGAEKTMGFKPGEKMKRLGEIVVLDTRFEPLNCITPDDVIREGLNFTVDEFIKFFCAHNKCKPTDPVNRILFDYCDQPDLIDIGPKSIQPDFSLLKFAANNEKGNWIGECSALEIGDLELELLTMDCDCGECPKGGNDHYDTIPAMYIRRKNFSLEFRNMADTNFSFSLRMLQGTYCNWVGNTQWDACQVRTDDLCRFVNWLRFNRYATACYNIYEWWENYSEPITLDNLYEAFDLEVQ